MGFRGWVFAEDGNWINVGCHTSLDLLPHTTFCVGASLLAKNVKDNAGTLDERGVLRFFASKLAPTGC